MKAIKGSEECRIPTLQCHHVKKPEFMHRQVCQPDHKKITFKMLVPWMEFNRSGLCCADVFPKRTRESGFLPHCPPGQCSHTALGVHQQPRSAIISLSSVAAHECLGISDINVMTTVWKTTLTGFRDTLSHEKLAWVLYYQLMLITCRVHLFTSSLGLYVI